jgi:sporulation protein YlmC with PRC-barrel domain
MKKLMIVMVTVFALGFTAGASYAGSMDSQSGYSPWAAEYKSAKSAERPFEYRASAIIGTYVQNKKADYLGRITDLMIDPHDGRIAFVVLSHGGVLGIPTRFVAVPFSALTPGSGKNVYLLDVTKGKMAAAPSFSRDNWPDVTNREWGAETYTYYGQTPYWEETEANCP